jgi:hypothetical protein
VLALSGFSNRVGGRSGIIERRRQWQPEREGIGNPLGGSNVVSTSGSRLKVLYGQDSMHIDQSFT